MTEKIWEKLNSLSEDAQNAAIAKAKELSFDLNKGLITMDESFINLNADAATLRDAIEKKKLQQLPLSVQKWLYDDLEKISKFLTGLTSGTDEVVNLVESIESLHTEVWRLGLQNLSDAYLGYQTKLNQIKNLEIQVRQLKGQLQQGLTLQTTLDKLVKDAQAATESLTKQLQTAETSVATSADHLKAVIDTDQKAAALLATIQQNETTSSQQVSSTKQNSADVLALKESINEFYKKVDEYRGHIDATTQKATTTVSNNETKTLELTLELESLEGQIKEQILRATGRSLFHSFQTRHETLARTKLFWIKALGFLIFVSLCFSVWLAISAAKEGINTAFYVKLSLTVPMVFAIGFCAVQYSRERRLEEEYAFKSNISISLIPYKELVEKLVDKSQPSERERFTSFIIDSITKVFTSPTDKIFETTAKDSSNLDKSIKRVVSLIKPIIKEVKH